eukprot:1196317-Prorocentrum_minimum.AAC.9
MPAGGCFQVLDSESLEMRDVPEGEPLLLTEAPHASGGASGPPSPLSGMQRTITIVIMCDRTSALA